MGIVDRIKQKCLEQKTTMAAIEKELSFGNGTIRRWEERVPGIDKVEILANKLNVSIEWLITGNDSSNLSDQEKELLRNFRISSNQSKEIILATARSAASTEKSSEWRIG